MRNIKSEGHKSYLDGLVEDHVLIEFQDLKLFEFPEELQDALHGSTLQLYYVEG